jgi:hypothetical protein
MAYPTISAPYGLKPVNLIGGQVFAGSTRNIQIQYNFGTNIFYGDVVGISRGFITRSIMTTGASAITGYATGGTIGVFLGCSFTDPVTKQKRFSQFWPANTLAGDAVAIVTDDPDTLFKVAAVTANAGTTIGSVARGMVGLNVTGSNLAGSVATGNSSNAIVPATAVENTASLPFRIVDVVPDTAIVSTATLSSGGGSTSLVCTGLSSTLPVGTEVGYLAANGQYIGTGSWVSSAVTGTGSQTISINSQAVTVNSPTGTASTGITIPAASTLVFTQYPEAIVKFNFGIHEYYNTAGQASTL